MTRRLVAWLTRRSTATDGDRRRSREFAHLFGLLLASLMILATISGCAGSSDSTPTANEQLCTDLSNLQDSLKAFLDVGSNEDMAAFRAKWDQVKTDLNSVKASAQKVANEDLTPVTAAFDALVQSVQNALGAGSVSAAVASIKTAATDFVNAVNTAVSELKCSS